MTDSTNTFANMVPGFEFLQGLVKTAGQALPNMGQWVAPTLDPEALEKKISELRTVQFWLEQNARLLGATIQAMEVQRMTLSTLKTMNVSFGDLTESLKIRMPEPAPVAAPAPAPSPWAFAAAKPAEAPAQAPAQAPAAAPAVAPAASSEPVVPAGVVDPMQWWSALTQQFTELAASAMKDTQTDAAKNVAGAMVKQSLDAASETLKKATALPASVVKSATEATQKMVKAAATSAAPRAATKKAAPGKPKKA